MIGYTTIGVKDMDAAKTFYAELLDAKVLVDVGRLAMIGQSTDEPMIAVCQPYNEEARIEGVFYGAYVKDPDGNKLCFFDFS